MWRQNTFPKKQTSISLEDEVEMLDFTDEVGVVFSPRKASTCNSDEGAISNNEKKNVLQMFSVTPCVKTFHKDGIHDFGSGKLDGESTWSAVNKEAEALIYLNENASCSSSSHSGYKVNKSGIQCKSKPKFSFRFQSQRGGISSSSVSKDEKGVSSKDNEVPKRFKTIDCGKHSIDKLCLGFPGKKAKQSEIVSNELEDLHCCSEHSMAELLDGLQDNNTLLQKNSNMHSRPREKRMHIDVKRSISPLGDRMLDSEDLPEPMRSTSSSYDEAHDEVEMPDFADEIGIVFSPRKASTCNSDEEAISDDEENVLQKFPVASGVKTVHKDGVHDFESGKLDGENAWSEVNKEAEALIRLNENAVCSSSSQRGGPSSSSISKEEKGVSSEDHEVPKRFKTIDCGKHSIDKLCLDFPGKKAKQSEIVSDEVEDRHCCSERSMAELLDGLQDNTALLKRNSNMYSRPRGIQVDVKRDISPLGDRMLNAEDLPEPVGCTSSSDDEAHDQNLKLAVPEMKRQTIVDRFQEALGATLRDEAAFVAAPRASGLGLFGKLQQVMQNEKYTEMNFLKLQTRAGPNDEQCHIDVKIIARYLDAKLIVCHASVGKDIEGPQWLENNEKLVNGGRERTIIFNPRVCCDVDLEVGNKIRIHPPWKEVQVSGHDKSIILSTYFSQIST